MGDPLLTPVLCSRQHNVLLFLILSWVIGTLAFWNWMLQPSTWTNSTGSLFNLLLLFYATGLPVWPFYLFLRMRQVRPDLLTPADCRVAMVVTKAPSEPWPLVQNTLLAMLAQELDHDTWLADEQPTDEVRRWCEQQGVLLSTRAGVDDYHRPTWPRRTRCKEGNLAYFYDHYGYASYDLIVQLDADHVPQPGYLRAMLQPFNDPQVGYVAAPSICNANAASSWVARGRLFAEAALHGPMQLGFNGSWAPLCIGSHYAVRAKALQESGGLGPELAEDHSTTLLLNAHGWRGAFAHRAICHGLGPQTFEDAMLQELQWSASLTTILLNHLRPLFRKLPPPLRLQFLYAQIYYPIRGSMSLLSLLLPVLAISLDHPWLSVHYPTFLAFCGLQMVLTILPVMYLRCLGLLRPAWAPLLSWEQSLFELSRGPWICRGVLQAVREFFWPRTVEFKVTTKQASAVVLPLRFLVPYLCLVGLGAGATLLFAGSTRVAHGYIYLTLITICVFAFTALSILVLSHRQSRHSFRRYLPHYGWVGGAVLLSLACCAWRVQDLARPFHLV